MDAIGELFMYLFCTAATFVLGMFAYESFRNKQLIKAQKAKRITDAEAFKRMYGIDRDFFERKQE